MQILGYMIAQEPARLLAAYNLSEFARKNKKSLRELREAFSQFDPSRYRGISRDPLEPYPSLDPKSLQRLRESGWELDSNAEARRRFREILGDLSESTVPDFDEYLVPTPDDAILVWSLLDDPNQWEIVELRRVEFHSGPDSLGFDIGWWGGDHFSLIADTIVIPQWHPPEPEDWVELRGKLSGLNGKLLLDTPGAAEAFRQYYLSNDWAEIDGEFCIIQVSAVDTASRRSSASELEP